MSEAFAIAAFLARWQHAVRHDLSGSDSETLPLADLLELAGSEDLARWQNLSFGYADPRGAPWLRAAIARRHTCIALDDVLCCAGAQEAVACMARALLGPNDHAIVVLPIYQPSEQAVTDLCAATGVPLSPQDWRLDLVRVAEAIRPNTKMVLTNFPNSPTGAAIDAGTLDGLVELCRRHGLWLVNDEVYRQTGCNDGSVDVPMVVDIYERGISINGLSKGFGLPGLRVGWAACRDPELLLRALDAKSLLSSCVSSSSEVLAHIALKAECTIVARTRAVARQNRIDCQALLARWPEYFEADSSQNLAFSFPRYRGKGSLTRFASRLIREAGVLVLPSTLWTSPLGATPTDCIRIGLGHSKGANGLEALEYCLDRCRRAWPDVREAGRSPLAAHLAERVESS